jgi:hypothetical protein
MRHEPPERAPARGLSIQPSLPMVEAIGRANHEAERKEKPAGAFWGNELGKLQ